MQDQLSAEISSAVDAVFLVSSEVLLPGQQTDRQTETERDRETERERETDRERERVFWKSEGGVASCCMKERRLKRRRR